MKWEKSEEKSPWIIVVFAQVFEFAVEQYESDTIEFEVYDEDPGKDDFIGR